MIVNMECRMVLLVRYYTVLQTTIYTSDNNNTILGD